MTGSGHWPSTYAGWAAVDATPQESSNNIMQCGPAPIKAIKEGHIYIGYDSNFVFGEVNADRITWICQKSGTDSGPFLTNSILFVDGPGIPNQDEQFT